MNGLLGVVWCRVRTAALGSLDENTLVGTVKDKLDAAETVVSALKEGLRALDFVEVGFDGGSGVDGAGDGHGGGGEDEVVEESHDGGYQRWLKMEEEKKR